MTNESWVRDRFDRAATTYEGAAVLQNREVDRIVERLLQMRPYYPVVWEIGCGTGRAGRRLLEADRVGTLHWNDLSEGMLAQAQAKLPETLRGKTTMLAGNAETLPWPTQVDLIFAGSVLQWFRRPRTFFEKAHRALRPGGLAVFIAFGPDNCREIRALTGAGLSYPSEAAWTAMTAGFRIRHRESRTATLTFATPRAVLSHLRATGVTGTDPGFRWTTSRLKAFENTYREAFPSPEGDGVALTYHPIVMILEKI